MIWKEAVAALIKTLCRNLFGGTEEDHETCQDSRSLDKGLNRGLSEPVGFGDERRERMDGQTQSPRCTCRLLCIYVACAWMWCSKHVWLKLFYRYESHEGPSMLGWVGCIQCHAPPLCAYSSTRVSVMCCSGLKIRSNFFMQLIPCLQVVAHRCSYDCVTRSKAQRSSQ